MIHMFVFNVSERHKQCRRQSGHDDGRHEEEV